MYLEMRKHVSKFDYAAFDRQADEWPPPLTREYSALSEYAPKGFDKFSDFSGITLTFPVGYWRKANAIHGWFVNTLANGVDECQPIYVSRENLEQLRLACNNVLKAPVGVELEDIADDYGLLPTQGFFFGSSEMDEYYMDDLRRTIQIIDNIFSLVHEDDYHYSFVYQASW
jgi:hypothetical protein